MGMGLRFRYRLDPQGRNLVVAHPGETTNDLVRDMVDVLTSFCGRLHGRRGARNRALRAITCAKRPPGAGSGPAGSGDQDG
jgi:putative resolvase